MCDAYGWERDIGAEEILERLVALNAQRAAEEAAGRVRYLRPEFQAPDQAAARPTQKELAITADEAATDGRGKPAKAKLKKQPWPKSKSLLERFQAVRSVLEQSPAPLSAAECRARFQGAKSADVAELLETLAALGQARQTDDGRFALL